MWFSSIRVATDFLIQINGLYTSRTQKGVYLNSLDWEAHEGGVHALELGSRELSEAGGRVWG